MRTAAIVMLASTAIAAQSRIGGISIQGPKCGELQCDFSEYCNFSDRCEDCSLICDSRNHNFDEALCMTNCQNYLHDMRYMKISSENANLTATVASLEKQVHTLTLTCGILLFFVIALGLAVLVPRYKGFSQWISRKVQKKKVHCTTGLTHENLHTESPVAPHRTRPQQTNIAMPTSQPAAIPIQRINTSMPTPGNNSPNSSTLTDSMAFTISNPGAIAMNSDFETEQPNPTSTQLYQNERESSNQQSNTTNGTVTQRKDREEISLNVKNLNRLASSQCTLPNTPDTQITRVDDLCLGNHTTRLPSEDCVAELKKNNIVNPIQYNPPQKQVIYTTLSQS